ncbi:carboxymuconolactone decarboxylase family protein [Oceanithermus sp.]|uniref:carboxymuconolactone decarboxylase family protein n=1 Tax=Oceanithermus sp. TaxID=2268145 RepID=UPI0025DA2558|nr:carboxymuconolactone decarboxylase family protein [Oceanithermus sp.]
MSVRKKIWGRHTEKIAQRLDAIDPDLSRYIQDFAYEEVMARPGLDLKTRELLAVTALIALGNPGELKTHLRGALENGATEREVRETIIHSALYLGFPRALGAMKMLAELLEDQD